MPRDMAMERPDAGVIRIIRQHDVARLLDGDGLVVAVDDLDCFGGGHDLHVAALRVADVLGGDGSVPCAVALGQDPEVVAVEMHWVGDG